MIFALVAVPATSKASFQLGLQDEGFDSPFTQPYARIADTAMGIIHGNTVRIEADWARIAPAVPGPGFSPASPADPGYSWSALDAAVRSAAQHHLRVLLQVLDAPRWAEGPGRPTNDPYLGAGAWDPNPAQFGAFLRAAALRYAGDFPDPSRPEAALPRVSYWEMWNEENLPVYLSAPDLVGEYRALLNAGYGAVKAVHQDNVVVLGGLAPVSSLPPYSMRPLTFGADLLCLRQVGHAFRRAGGCPAPAHFDVFAYHPYTVAVTPTKPAYYYGDVLVADAGKVARLVRASDRLHTSQPTGRHAIWVTEWAWFTDPPNSVGDAQALAARYVAYSLYELAHNGVSLTIWQTVTDQRGSSAPGAGLYTSAGRPKLTLSSFAFPFVALHRGRRVFAWGRAPVEAGAVVIVQHKIGRRWATLARLRTAADGEFSKSLAANSNGLYRAEVTGGPVSLAYDSAPIPPRRTHSFPAG